MVHPRLASFAHRVGGLIRALLDLISGYFGFTLARPNRGQVPICNLILDIGQEHGNAAAESNHQEAAAAASRQVDDEYNYFKPNHNYADHEHRVRHNDGISVRREPSFTGEELREMADAFLARMKRRFRSEAKKGRNINHSESVKHNR